MDPSGTESGSTPHMCERLTDPPIAVHCSKDNSVDALQRRNHVVIDKSQLLGMGVVGDVYKGHFNGRDVAVKQFRHVYDSSIWTEIEFLSSLQSEHIVQLLHIDVHPNERRVSLVLELMAMNLRQRLGQDTKLSLAQKVRIALDVIRGVAFLHAQKIVYCNLTADNVLLDDDGRGKLSGFGITQHNTPGREVKQQGTPQYMAPELTVYPATAPSEASDVYAFGILLTELDANTGEVPYNGRGYDNPYALWNQVRGGLRPALRDDCPPWFQELTVQCMATLPSDRPAVSTIIDTLEEKLRDVSATEVEVSSKKLVE